MVIATLVVIQGADDGLFVYNGAPGPGTLIASIAATGGTDPYGNAYLQGVEVQGGGDNQIVLYPGVPAVVLNPDTTKYIPLWGRIYGQDQGAHGDIILESPINASGAPGMARLILAGQDSGGGQGAWFRFETTGTPTGYAQFNVPAVAADPTSSTVAETWHDMTLASGQWSNPAGAFFTCSYRLLPDGDVEIRGTPVFTGNGTTGLTDPTTLATLPAGYRPASLGGPVPLVPTGGTVTLTANRIPHVRISTAGVVQVFGLTSPATAGVTANLFFQGTFSL